MAENPNESDKPPISPAGAAPEPAKPTVPAPARNPGWFSPVFVLAPARSNSSVVSSMIGMHPDLYGFPELSLWRGPDVEYLITDRPNQRGLNARARTAGLSRAIAELFQGKQDQESVQWARQWLAERPNWDVASVFDALQAKVYPRIAFEKSPENSNRQDYLERLDTAYPRARFLHLTRHPVPTVNSMHAAWKSAGLWDVPEELFHMHLLGTWLFHHGRVKKFTESLPPDRWMRVRTEDVLNNPHETLPGICRWLGVSSGEAAIDAMMHPEKSPFARIGPKNALGGNDPGFLREPVPHQAVNPSSLDIPAEWVVDPWLHLAVVEFASSLGYIHGSKDEPDPH